MKEDNDYDKLLGDPLERPLRKPKFVPKPRKTKLVDHIPKPRMPKQKTHPAVIAKTILSEFSTYWLGEKFHVKRHGTKTLHRNGYEWLRSHLCKRWANTIEERNEALQIIMDNSPNPLCGFYGKVKYGKLKRQTGGEQ